MKRTRRALNGMIVGGAAATALVIATSSASAQDATSSTTGSSTSTTTTRAPRTQATPQMIREAIQRSQARTEKLRTTGRPEQFGSEEPFTFDPSR
jgi:hypothetical protein